jgi:hypothetical protein
MPSAQKRHPNGKRVIRREMSQMTPVQAAVIGDLMTGMAWKTIHDKYGVAQSTIENWLREFGMEKPPPQVGRNTPLPSSAQVMLHPRTRKLVPPVEVQYPSYSNIDPETGQVKDIRIQLVDYIQNSLLALNSQLLVGADPAWIAKQNAADIASFHKVVGDRLERLVAAFAAGQQVDNEVFDDEEDGVEMVSLDQKDVPG